MCICELMLVFITKFGTNATIWRCRVCVPAYLQQHIYLKLGLLLHRGLARCETSKRNGEGDGGPIKRQTERQTVIETAINTVCRYLVQGPECGPCF